MAHLQRRTKPFHQALAGEGLQEPVEPRQVEVKCPRQLKQHGAEGVCEVPGAVEEGPQGLLDVFEPLHVGDEPAGLDGKDKTLGNALAPRHKRLLCGEPVERVVQLDGVELLGVEGEPLVVGELTRVEQLAPMWIDVTAGADEQAPAHLTSSGPWPRSEEHTSELQSPT